jgi:S-DNA-T family DNA segregation ATPase FtsK/SpoIIIE
MKPIRIVLSPTHSRPVNIFLGLVLMLLSILLLLALATYHATDPSWNTSTDPAMPHAALNWIGLFGAYLSDLLLQTLGVAALFLPLWTGGIGWGWMRSRPGGSAVLRCTGALLTIIFVPGVFGLLPWHWSWKHLIPVEGVVGRLMSGLLVGYLNIQGAWIVAGVLAAVGLYFALAISIRAIIEGIEDRWLQMVAWRDRWRNWREERAELRAEPDRLRPDVYPWNRP